MKVGEGDTVSYEKGSRVVLYHPKTSSELLYGLPTKVFIDLLTNRTVFVGIMELKNLCTIGTEL